jgi:hypothetical protein
MNPKVKSSLYLQNTNFNQPSQTSDAKMHDDVCAQGP